MRKFKLLVKDSGAPSLAILKYFDKNIEQINSMGVVVSITKIDENDLDKEMVNDLAENGIVRLPALITDNDKKFAGIQKIKDVFNKNLQAYKRRDVASSPRAVSSTNTEFGTNPDLAAYYQKHLIEDKSDETDDAKEIVKDIERKRREYKPPKHRVDVSKERNDDMAERARGTARRRGNTDDDDAPAPRGRPARRDEAADPDDNIEVGTLGSSVLESVEATEHEENSGADDAMERAYWENKSSGFAPE